MCVSVCEAAEVYTVVIHVMLTQVPRGRVEMSVLVEATVLCFGLELVAWERARLTAQQRQRQRQAVVL